MSLRRMHMLHSLDAEVGDIGSTVRLGTKWADSLGDDLILCVCTDRCQGCNEKGADPVCANCSNAGRGIVEYVWRGRFIDIPAWLIEQEHEERSRMYSGLKASMTKAYGDAFHQGSNVAVVQYRRIV